MFRKVNIGSRCSIAKRLSLMLAVALMAGVLPFGAVVQAAPTATINVGSTAITGGTGWKYANNVFTISNAAKVVLTGNTTANRVVVAAGATATVTLQNVNIDLSAMSDTTAFDLSGANVTLILAGKNTLKSAGRAAGIHANIGSALTIESANGGGSTNGVLDVIGGDRAAGIGGSGFGNDVSLAAGAAASRAAGSITINGGTVNATGSGYQVATENKVGGGAGIGGGYQGDGGTITINGGEVRAQVNTDDWGAACIGGGGSDTDNDTFDAGEAGDITITGGVVKLECGLWSAGIGSGYTPRNRNDNGRITITGGVVTVSSKDGGAAIGGGNLGNAGTISISGGEVSVLSTRYGAGIGGGDRGGSGTINISGGTVSAESQDSGAGIGSGYSGDAGQINISGGTVSVIGWNGAGIGGGQRGSSGVTHISGGTVTATGNGGGAAIGGGLNGKSDTVIISGGTVTATGNGGGAAIGGGQDGTGGAISFLGGTITATGMVYGAGVGGGQRGAGGTISFLGGTVTALNKKYGAAIGGGLFGAGGKIWVKGGTVWATSLGGGAAMGGGYSGAAGEILIDGGMIEARSFQEGAGIGSGFQGAGGTITINSGRVFAHTTRADGTGTSATVGNPAAIGGARGSGSGVINISGGVVVADTGDASSAGIGGGFGQTTGEINISGGVVISYGGVGVNASNDDMGARITTRISGNAMVFANNDKTEAINNQSNQGGSVFGNDGMDIKYNVIRLKADLTIPEGAFLIIPEGYCLRTADRRLTNYGVIISEGEIIGDVPPLYPISFTAILAGEGSNTMMNATYAGESVLSGAQVSSGETLIVSVSTENTNPHSFEWTKNNIVQDETSNTFTVKNIFGPTALTCTTRVSLSNAVLVIADQAWTGSALTPAVQIELSGEIVALTESKDYVTKYALNIDPGTASVTVVGIGKYTGAATGSFQIIRLPVVPTFVDVAATHVLFERVEWLAAQGITSGYLGANGAEYRPANTVLRSEMATFLYRLAGSPTFNALGSSAFVDVPTTAGYFNAMSWLVEHKITSGYTGANGVEYRPGNNVSRAEMATFLYRLAGSPAFSAPVDSMFVDVSPSAGYYKAVAWLVSTGVTTGYADTAGTQYRPSNSVTRGEMATFLWRMADKELVANF